MANRRMFSLDVVDTDRFLEMPTSTQALYFHLGMRADDEGFVASPKKITNFVGCNEDDLKLLAVKKFITPFESGIIVITEWNVHNWIRSDRKHETRFQDEKSMLSLCGGIYVLADNVQPIDRQMSDSWHPEVRLGKDSIDNIINYQEIINKYNEICISFPKCTKLSEKRKKAIKARLKNYTVEDFIKLFKLAESSSFLKGQNKRNWSATFDWLICDGNMAKVLDGNYSDRGNSSKTPEPIELPDYYQYLGNTPPSPDDPF